MQASLKSPPKRRRKPANGEAQRFFREVVLPYAGEGCLQWPYARNELGYGIIGLNGSKRTAKVHRLACVEVHGEPPTSQHVVAHSCGKGHEGCCNPRHLRWATRKENASDQIRHGTAPRGERCGTAKLTREQVRHIRVLSDSYSQKRLAKEFGVSRSLVGFIQQGKRWEWLP